MDPASVVGLVAACASLTKTCVSLVKGLHDIAQVYKDAELEIISMADQCKVIQFAWKSLEEWANEGLLSMVNHEEVVDRLQDTIYTGGLILEALKNEVANATPKSFSNFRRHATIAWNASSLRDHQTRVDRHNSALQLLLHIISMPRNEDRLEVMSVKQHIFDEAHESVRAIPPSHMSSRLSSRLSLTNDDTNSVKSETTLRYIRRSFDYDLFASYVYRRSYCLAFLKRSSSSSTIRTPKRPQGDQALNTAFRSEGHVKIPDLTIPLREYIDTCKEAALDDNKVQATVAHLRDSRYAEALSYIHDDVDIAILFQPHCGVDADHLIAFFWHILHTDSCLFNTLLQRIAFSAGEHWVERFQAVFRQHQPICADIPSPKPDWSSAAGTGRCRDGARSWVNHLSLSPTALQLACAAGNYLVTEYLLRVGFRPDPGAHYKHPLLYAVKNGDTEMVKLLYAWIDIPKDIFTVALLSLFNLSTGSIFWCNGLTLTPFQLSAVMTDLLDQRADPSAKVYYLGNYIPLLHGVIYALHCNKDRVSEWEELFGRLLEAGSDVDELYEVCWDQTPSAFGNMRASPLALAAALGEDAVFRTLVTHGAKIFSWSGEAEQIYGGCVNPATGENALHALALWCSESKPDVMPELHSIRVDLLPEPYWITSLWHYQLRCRTSFRYHKDRFERDIAKDLIVSAPTETWSMIEATSPGEEEVWDGELTPSDSVSNSQGEEVWERELIPSDSVSNSPEEEVWERELTPSGPANDRAVEISDQVSYLSPMLRHGSFHTVRAQT